MIRGDNIKIEKYGLEFNQTLCLNQGTVNVFVRLVITALR